MAARLTTHKVKVISKRFQRAFTLIEVLCVVAILGFMAAMILPGFAGISEGADLDKAKVNACLVSAAKDMYLREQGQVARTAWAAAATDADKFVLIRGYLGASSSLTLATYVPSGYTISMGNLGESVTLWKGAQSIAFN